MSVTFKLDDLYNTEAEVALPDGKVILVRTLTDAEVNHRELEAIKAASVVEAEFEDETSQRYKDLIEPLQRLDHDGLVAIIMAVQEVVIREEVVRENPFRYVPFPDDATEDEKRDVMRRREEQEAQVRQRRSEEISRRLSARREEMQILEDDDLMKRAKRALVNTEAFNRRIEEFYTQTVYQSTWLDSKHPFKLEAVRGHGKRDGLNEKVFRKILEVYGEIDTADPWVLQKHP
jgi:hypothetical protein